MTRERTHIRCMAIILMLYAMRLVDGFRSIASVPARHRTYSVTTICRLNRFLFDASEISSSNEDNSCTATIPKDDYRTIHAAKVLGLHNGDEIRAGIVSNVDNDGYLTDTASIQWIPQGNVKKAEPLGNGDPPGSLQITLNNLQPATVVQDVPAVSLILALPRPLQLGRMLPMIAQMGVDRLILTRAAKVPKDYFGSHLFRKPQLLRERLIEGLCQAGDVRVPTVTVVHNLSKYLTNDLDEMFPSNEYARVFAHPQRQGESVTNVALRMKQIEFPVQAADSKRRVVVAVGPEGGWEEPSELDLLTQHGFQQVTMGTRTLRSDVAVVGLLSLAHDVCTNIDT